MIIKTFNINTIEFKFYINEPGYLYIDNELICEFNNLSLIDELLNSDTPYSYNKYLDTLLPDFIKELLSVNDINLLHKNVTTYFSYVYNSNHDIFWEYVYETNDLETFILFKKEFDKLLHDINNEYTYDYRIAELDNEEQIKIYNKHKNNSFLGKKDKQITVNNKIYIIGFNYGD